jgi:N-acetylneuraminate synthase
VVNSLSIDRHEIGPGRPCFLIAEIALAHEGSLGIARAMVDAAAESGVDAVKFQTHIAEAESTSREQFRVPVFPQDISRYDYWKRTSFTPEQWKSLAAYVREKGLVFLSSPFSEEAVEILLQCDIPAWKIASGEVCNLPILERIAETRLPVILSSGLSTWAELDRTTQFLTSQGAQFAILQCTSAYPCPPNSWGLNLIGEIRERYACPVGLSDHSGGLAACLAAATLGANILEFHLTLSPKMFGPDVASSLTVEQASDLVLSVRQLQEALSAPVDKDRAAGDRTDLRRMFTKSVVAAEDLDSGTVLTRKHLAFKKPGDGIPAWEYQKLIDQQTVRRVAKDQPLSHDDLQR